MNQNVSKLLAETSLFGFQLLVHTNTVKNYFIHVKHNHKFFLTNWNFIIAGCPFHLLIISPTYCEMIWYIIAAPRIGFSVLPLIWFNSDALLRGKKWFWHLWVEPTTSLCCTKFGFIGVSALKSSQLQPILLLFIFPDTSLSVFCQHSIPAPNSVHRTNGNHHVKNRLN